MPRYNQFHRLLHIEPVKSFEEITSNKERAREPDLAPVLRQVENASVPWARVDAPGAPSAGSK